jgi:hypothetical protein
MGFKFQPRGGSSPTALVTDPSTALIDSAIVSEPRENYGTANESVKVEYQAYRFSSSGQAPLCLWIRRHVGKGACDFAPTYAYRRSLNYDGNGYFISMNYTDCRVQVFGRNLHDLFLKLLRCEVEWIQEHDPQNWKPPEAATPIITAIKVLFKPTDPNDSSDLTNLKRDVKH